MSRSTDMEGIGGIIRAHCDMALMTSRSSESSSSALARSGSESSDEDSRGFCMIAKMVGPKSR